MPESTLLDFTVTHARPQAFYDIFERKGELQQQTHYCPGCGHGIVHKLLAKAIDELGVQDRTVLISPWLLRLAYYHFDVGNVQVAHGRAPPPPPPSNAAAPTARHRLSGRWRSRRDRHRRIIHAANRGEPLPSSSSTTASTG